MSDMTKYSKVLGIVAVSILIMSGVVLAYNITQRSAVETDTFLVNGKEYNWETTFERFDIVTLESPDGTQWTGIRVTDLLNDSGIANPEIHQYKVVGVDGYSKTVGWSDMEKGLLTKSEKRTFFPDLPKAYYVRDLIRIEVI